MVLTLASLEMSRIAQQDSKSCCRSIRLGVRTKKRWVFLALRVVILSHWFRRCVGGYKRVTVEMANLDFHFTGATGNRLQAKAFYSHTFRPW